MDCNSCGHEFLVWVSPCGTVIYTTCERCFHENAAEYNKPFNGVEWRERALDAGNV